MASNSKLPRFKSLDVILHEGYRLYVPWVTTNGGVVQDTLSFLTIVPFPLPWEEWWLTEIAWDYFIATVWFNGAEENDKLRGKGAANVSKKEV